MQVQNSGFCILLHVNSSGTANDAYKTHTAVLLHSRATTCCQNVVPRYTYCSALSCVEVSRGSSMSDFKTERELPVAHKYGIAREVCGETSEAKSGPSQFCSWVVRPGDRRHKVSTATVSVARTNQVCDLPPCEEENNQFDLKLGFTDDRGRRSPGHRQTQSGNNGEIIKITSSGQDKEELVQASAMGSSQRCTELSSGTPRSRTIARDSIPAERVYVGVHGYLGTALDPLLVCVSHECLVLRLKGNGGAEVGTEGDTLREEVPYKSIKKIQ
jgi:hypothetical protein